MRSLEDNETNETLKEAEGSEGLSIGDLSAATGIGIPTLRQWEARYGQPHPMRRESGHRRYDPSEVTRLRLVKSVMETGLRAHKAVPLSKAELVAILKDRGNETSTVAIEAWFDAVRNWDENLMASYLERDWSLLGPLGFVEERVGPFLERLGEGWSHGQISVAQEHFFSEYLESFLSGRWREMNAKNSGDVFVLATVGGEEHGLGLQMCATVLCAMGKRVLFLGAKTPMNEVVEACKLSNARGLCLSFSSYNLTQKPERIVSELVRLVPSDCQVVVGGAGAPKFLPDVIGFSDFRKFYEWFQYGMQKQEEGQT